MQYGRIFIVFRTIRMSATEKRRDYAPFVFKENTTGKNYVKINGKDNRDNAITIPLILSKAGKGKTTDSSRKECQCVASFCYKLFDV